MSHNNPLSLLFRARVRARFFVLNLLFCALASLPFSLQSNDEVPHLPKTDKIDVHLLHPTFCDGTLSTEQGGVITAEGLRIQAKKIIYTKSQNAHRITAEGELLVECGIYTFVGDRLDYDISEKAGVIYNGRTALEPWFFGGEQIHLLADGSYLVYNAFLTTSEDYDYDWAILSQRASLTQERYLQACGVKFKFLHLPLISIPSVRANLDSIFDLPIRFSVKWGGQQGSRIGMKYGLISWKNWKSFLRLDYRIKRGGLGGGVELYYHSNDKKEKFESINYIARDSTIVAPQIRTRYRFQGVYTNKLQDDSVDVTLTYDKLSDSDMATDYNDRGLELETAGRTQLLIHKQHPEWIGNFISRVRVNSFQTLKQELPTFQGATIPISLVDKYLVWENNSQASYLDFMYQNSLTDVHDYKSTRLDLAQKLYSPFRLDGWVFTPAIAGRALFYGNTKIHHRPHTGAPRWAASVSVQCDLTKRFAKTYGNLRHVVKPYSSYQFWTMATTAPNDHYIFDIDDGLTRLNQWKLGVENSLYRKTAEGTIERFMHLDLYTYLFFDTPEIGAILPKVYATGTFRSWSILRHTIDTAWDFQHNELNHINFRTGWTINENLAFAAEYRHRDIWAWRKANYNNFFLDSYRSQRELVHSSLSDRRDTVLFHCFYRFHPCYALELESRSGWNRRFEPSYNEFEVDVLATLRSAWNVKVGYERKEYGGVEHRFTVAVSLGIRRPDQPHKAPPPFFDF